MPPKNCTICPKSPKRYLCIRSNKGPSNVASGESGVSSGGSSASGGQASQSVSGGRSGASSNDSAGRTGGGLGHANLAIYEGPNGPCGPASLTLGSWPDDMHYLPDSDVSSDVVKNHPWDNPAGYPFAYCLEISDAQYKKLQELTKDKQWSSTDILGGDGNCSDWASDTFHEVTGVEVDSSMMITTPKSVGSAAVGLNGGHTGPYCGAGASSSGYQHPSSSW